MAFPIRSVLLDNADLTVRWFNRAASTLLDSKRPGDTLQPLRVWQHHPKSSRGCQDRAGTAGAAVTGESGTSPAAAADPFSSQQNLLVAETSPVDPAGTGGAISSPMCRTSCGPR